MNEHFSIESVSNRLFLRKPQEESLQLLERIMAQTFPTKETDVQSELQLALEEFADCSLFKEFDRSFPSYCFALATGVGKTRLMGAFISYLSLNYGLRNFLVLAPNLTIYNKLITDFTPNTSKYVFGGIEEFVLDPPKIITGDNYESGRGVRQNEANYLPENNNQPIRWESTVFVNIFNIAKITAKDKGHFASGDSAQTIPRFRRNNENIGEGGYFQYLADLKDLVVIMDESHQYRADAGMTAINDLKPILGLELTATPQVQQGSKKPVPFGNIIYNYPLANAIADGFVKMPAVATRENFNANLYNNEQLEQLKLQDGIHLHEETKMELAAYAKNNNVPEVKPFVLVIARDTVHAEELKKKIESEDFFDGKYIGKVITVHSNTKGSEKDEVIEQLLNVEKLDNPIEIVIHVNMLKEGWDVTNLYTIIPLRAADSQTLVEQSIGRGLRLPYGKRTGVDAVDRLTIVAHEHFENIVRKANDGSLHYNIEKLVIKENDTGKKSIPQYSVFETQDEETQTENTPNTTEETAVREMTGSSLQSHLCDASIPQEIVSRLGLEIRRNKRIKPEESITSPEYRQRILAPVVRTMIQNAEDLTDHDKKQLETKCEKALDVMTRLVMEIPKVVLLPLEENLFGYLPFKLNTDRLNFTPIQSDILIENLDRSGVQQTLSKGTGDIQQEKHLEDYIVRELIGYDGIDYDDNADLLYDLSSQAVAYLKSYLKDDDELLNVLTHYQKEIGSEIYDQMQQSMEQREAKYEVQVSKRLAIVESGRNYMIGQDEMIRDFRSELMPGERNQIKSMVFGGYRKSIFFPEKFDSYSELEFVRFLESKPEVLKWLRPTTKQIRIVWKEDQCYEPDFLIETQNGMLMVEIKRRSELDDSEVVAKAKAATLWCKHATFFAEKHGGKAWKYLVIPHDEIRSDMSLDAVVKKFEWNEKTKGNGQYTNE